MNAHFSATSKGRHGMSLLITQLLLLHFCHSAFGQDEGKPQIVCIHAQEPVRLDGWLNEADWDRADSIYLAMVEPQENGSHTFQTLVKILVDQKNIYIGLICFMASRSKLYPSPKPGILNSKMRIISN